MSWGKSVSGTAAEVKEQAQAWEQAVVDIDRGYKASEEVVQLHQEQVRRCATTAIAFADAAKDGYVISVSAGGHAAASTTEVTADNWYVNLSTHKPLPETILT